MSYLILHRALKNAGDFLIGKRAYELIHYLRPERKLIIGRAWQALDEQLSDSVISDLEAIIISGGPGYLPNMYPDIYPLVENVTNYKTPIFLMGLGVWMSGSQYEGKKPYLFTDASKRFLFSLDQKGIPLGARDMITLEVLKGIGIKGVQQQRALVYSGAQPPRGWPQQGLRGLPQLQSAGRAYRSQPQQLAPGTLS